MPRWAHTGRVMAMVSTQSSTVISPASMVERILAVRVERMLAFTPLPRPSASTMMKLSSRFTVSTWSPQSCSPALFMESHPCSR